MPPPPPPPPHASRMLNPPTKGDYATIINVDETSPSTRRGDESTTITVIRRLEIGLAFLCGALVVLGAAAGVSWSARIEWRDGRAPASLGSEPEYNKDSSIRTNQAMKGVKMMYRHPYPGHFASIGEWPMEYLTPIHAEASLGKRGAAPQADSQLGWWKPNQAEINAFISEWSWNSVHGKEYTGVVVPKDGKEKAVAMKNASPMFYNFVHVPKAGGTYFSIFLSHTMEKIGEKHGYSYPLNVSPFNKWITLPLVDTSQNNVVDTAEHFRTKEPAAFFSTEHLRQQYKAGKRYFGKGQFGVGLCDAMDVPCAYLTVLREPVARYISHYKYSCLEGAEGRAQWLPEWKVAGECPLDPIEFMDHLGPNLDWNLQLAPGNMDPQSRADRAKANLGSACFRFLLMEKYQDGTSKMRATFPDFEGVHDISDPHLMNPSKPMNSKEKARMDAYLANSTIADAIAERHKYMSQVYDFAVERYEELWSKPFVSC